MQKQFVLLLLIFLSFYAQSQLNIQAIEDKCGHATNDKFLLETLGDHWGYNYDSLLNDIDIWELSEFVQVSSIGQSTLDREIYELLITDFEESKNLKHRVFIHARTHPNEVQSFWVTDEMINFLIQDTEIGNFLRKHCIFHVIPMYNPDGVELEYPRENANGVDIESNWDESSPEIEVQHLRNRFEELMWEDNPIELALNMHSAYACERYFVYHHEVGTSNYYTEIEKDFITAVRSQYMSGIQPWSYYVSWSSGTPDQYPESWWWLNYEEDVLALTYEDMNCEEAGNYDLTAYAILYGINEHLGLDFGTAVKQNFSKAIVQAYPNPFTTELNLFTGYLQVNEITISDIAGSIVKRITINSKSSKIVLSNLNLSNGIYYLNLQGNFGSSTLKIIKAAN